MTFFKKIADYFIPQLSLMDDKPPLKNIDHANHLIDLLKGEFNACQFGLVFWRTTSIVLGIILLTMLVM